MFCFLPKDHPACEKLYSIYRNCMWKNIHEKELAIIHCQTELNDYIKCYKLHKLSLKNSTLSNPTPKNSTPKTPTDV